MLSARLLSRCGRSVASRVYSQQQARSKTSLVKKLGIIGGGRMTEAALNALKNIQNMDDVYVYDTNDSRLDVLRSKFGVHKARSPDEAVSNADFVLLAVKPQHVNMAGAALTEPLSGWLLSVVAGYSIESLQSVFKTPKVIRTMPNTPAIVLEGMTVWTAAPDCPADIMKTARSLLGSMGEELYVVDESYIDMATAISGSGPAYVFLTMEAMVDAAVHLGFPRNVATRLVVNTIRGSATLALQSDTPLEALRHNVTSPGGTTASALYAFERGAYRTVVADAIWAAYRRSLELGGKSSNIGPGRSPYNN